MQDETGIESPFNSVPPVILVLVSAILGLELMFSLAEFGLIGPPQAIGWRIAAIEDYAVSPLVLDAMIERNDTSWFLTRRFLAYPFIHIAFIHTAFSAVMLLALGKFVGEAWHWMSLVVVMLVAGLAGAIGHALTAAPQMPLIGAYPALYGLIGAFTYLQWLKAEKEGGNRWMAFRLVGVLIGLQIVFGFMFGGVPHLVADLCGFVAGLCLSPLLGPGGFRHFVERLRQR